MLAAMGEMFTSILDVTIVYPDGAPSLWAMFCGRIRRAIVHVEQRPVPQELLGGDYADDPGGARALPGVAPGVVAGKDELIGRLLHESESATCQ